MITKSLHLNNKKTWWKSRDTLVGSDKHSNDKTADQNNNDKFATPSEPGCKILGSFIHWGRPGTSDEAHQHCMKAVHTLRERVGSFFPEYDQNLFNGCNKADMNKSGGGDSDNDKKQDVDDPGGSRGNGVGHSGDSTAINTAATSLSLQTKLLLLRYCYAPTLNHHLRNMHPDDVRDAATEFDLIIISTLSRLSGFTLSEKNITAARLPVKLGGLGLLSNADLCPYAATACYLLSAATLGKKNIPIFGLRAHSLAADIKLCADHLNIPALDIGLFALNAKLQCSMTRTLHQLNWLDLFLTCGNNDNGGSKACSENQSTWAYNL